MEATVTTSAKAPSPLMASIGDSSALSPGKSSNIDTGQMRSSSPFTPNSFHKNSLMSSSSPPAAATAGSPLQNEITHLSPNKETALIGPNQQQPAASAASIRDGADLALSSSSDVETFNGKIVYNPDGSAYIIEGPDSDGSEVEAEISQEGSIIDARGLSPNCGTTSFPQIVSAFHISRSSAALYSALYGQALSQNSSNGPSNVGEVPMVHSYRVFSFRNKKSDSQTELENGLTEGEEETDEESKLNATNCSTVPVKPILMCFICKLSFGYTKSFIAHTVGEHCIVLNDEEKRVLAAKNTSAIIQGVGKEKEPLLSFLTPKSSPAPFCTPSQQQLEAKRLLAAQMAAVASAFRSNSLSTSPPNSVAILPEKAATLPTIQSSNSPKSAVTQNPEVTNLSFVAEESQTKFVEPEAVSNPEPNDEAEEHSENEEMDTSVSESKQSTADSTQFASELADLANLEKFAKAAAAAAQQQMDLQSIAAAMAVAVAASNQNRTPSPASKNSKSVSGVGQSNSQNPLLTSSASAFPAITSVATSSMLSVDGKAISLFSNAGESDPAPTHLASNTISRPNLSSNHPPLLMQHSRNSCKTLKCPKCNWHYKYQETLEIHMKEKHPENEMNCIYCLTNQPHPRLARGETYTCGYKPYRCDVCNYSTTTKGNLSIHMQSDKHINNVQELQNGNIPATAEHLLQSQALAAAVAQASAANGTGSTQNTTTTSNVPISSAGTISNSSSGSPTPTPAGVNLAAIAAAAQQDSKNQLQKISQHSNTPTTNSPSQSSSTANSSGGKQKATWRCDVCNYETNVARNLRIHMTSEKHTHNIMVLKQNVTQMQQLSALQQAGIINQDQLLQFNPGLFAAAAAAAAGINNPGQSNDTGAAIQPEAAHTLADMAYNHALLMMASQQQQQQQQRAIAAIMQQQQQANATTDHKSLLNSQLLMSNGSQPTFDMEHPDPSLTGMGNAPYDDSCRLFHCCVCTTFTTDSIEDLSQHIQCDRTRTREDEVLMSVGGSYICKLCSYKTNLKANFQLHCKTDKHLQRLQHVNHIKEGGQQSEWKLKFINVSNPVQVRCNVCDYYTNSIHKLQLHTANPRHDICSRIFIHLQLNDLVSSSSSNNSSNTRYYFCSLCSAATRTKISLIQHLNSVKHLRNESLRQLKHQTQPGGMKDSEDEIRDMFLVKELLPGEKINFENDDDQQQQQLGLGNSIVSPSLAGTGQDAVSAASSSSSAVVATEQMFLKNALMEHAANSQLEAAKMAALAAMDNHQADKQSDQSNQTVSCPFCPFSNSNELHVQLHILTTHQQQAQQHHALQQQQQQQQQQASNIPATPPPSILCPLCQEPFHEKVTLENHLVEVHSVTKEGVQRLMLLVDTSEFDKFMAAKKKKQQQQQSHNKLDSHYRRDTHANSHAATSHANAADDEDEDCRRSVGSGDSGSKQAEDELLEAGNMLAAGNANNAILEHLLCPICNRMYLTLDELFSHMTSQLHIKPMIGGMFQCWRTGCNQSFKTIVATQQHFKDHHFLKCAKLANSSANLASNAPVSDRHVYKYRCSQCSLAFKTFEKLQLHSQYHLIRAATQCVICGRSFRSVESLQKHVDSSHSDMNEEELEQYKTSLMNNQLLFALRSNGGILDPSTTELLKKESSRFDGNHDESMEVDDEDAIDLANPNQHSKDDDQLMDTSDPNNSDNLSNVVNGNTAESSLEDYLNSQSVAEDNYNDPNRKYKCHRCKVAFTRQSYLTSHNKTLLHRKGEKMSYPMEKYLDPNRPFKCEICKESFTQKNILLVHYNSVSHLHKLKQSMKESSAAVAASVAASGNVQLTEPESEGENKPFRCNLCKVSYSNAPALDSHIRSPLHHTRTSKLHELALSGQLDLSLSLIERPDTLETNNNHPSKANANNDQCQQHSKPASTPSPCPTPTKLPDMLAGLTEQQQQALAFQQAAINFAIATGQSPAAGQSQLMQLAGQSPFTCAKCGAAFISQDAQLQHQQLCGLFGNVQQPNTGLQPPQQPKTPIPNFQAPICKTKPHLYKNLLESWGFEIVMQFNESNQKKKKAPEVKLEDGEEAETTEIPEIEPKVEEEPEESSNPQSNTSDLPPEINRCRCDICLKEFSSIWVLKAHREEIHKDVVPLDVVESFADEYRTEFERKFSNGNDDETNDSTVEESQNASTGNANDQNNQEQSQQEKSQPITFPGSSISNINTKSTNNNNHNNSNNSNPNSNCNSTNAESNINQNLSNANQNAAMNAMNASLAQFMPQLPPNASPNDIAAANQMAAAQLQFGQLLMSMGLAGMAAGMPMQAGMNVPFAAAAAMGIPPQLIPVMMADPMMAAAAAFNNPALAAAAAAQMNPNQVSGQNPVPDTPSPAPVGAPSISVSQPSVSQTPISSQAAAAAAAAAQQKRARTRISDEQLKVLRQYFDINNSPTEEQLIEMSQKSGLPMKVIKHWFRNTLFKERQRNKDSPYNFNNPPSTFLNLDEYEKTGETKMFTMDEVKKTEPVVIEPPKEVKETKVIPKPPAEYESEPEGKNCSNDFKSSSSAKDTDYNSSDDESEVKPKNQPPPPPPPTQSEFNAHLQKQQAQFQAQFQQQAQEFDQLTKAMALNINSPQPSESSMSDNSESTSKTANTGTSSMFAGLSNFGSGLSSSQNMTSSPLFSFDAAQRSQLAAAAAAAANSPTMMSNAGHSVSSHSSSGKRANRTRFTDYQIKVLQEFFESNAYPKDDDLEYLSKLLNLSPRVIVVWFQNARQKARKVYENQPPTTPIGEDDGSGRFQRTPGLNYQCKKCLQVFQRYYELIKHQKSSCFKDENPLAAQIRMAAEARAQASSPGSSTNCDAPSTPMDCSRSATATPEKMQPMVSMLTSPRSVSVTSPSPSGMSLTPNHKTSPPSIETQTFRCDKCTKVFNRFDMWRDHQIEHIVNTNLFNSAGGNPFASMMQMEGLHHQQQLQPQPSMSPQPNISPNSSIFQQGIKRKQVTTDDDDDEESHDFDSMSGNGGGSNSGDQAQRDKRLRTTILPEQLDYLYQKYQIESNPSRKMLESIAKEVGLKKRVVQVWFQNTRARERKGQFRAHQQVIHKRCPFCRALFKARSALESHLATRHADQYTKGDINIDALPDGDPDEDGDSSVNEGNMDNVQMADVMKRYYEDSFKKYLDELNIQGKGGSQLPAEFALKMKTALDQAIVPNTTSAAAASTAVCTVTNSTLLNPLDLSQTLSMTTANRHNSNGEDEGFDDTRSEEFDSDAEEEIDFDYSQCSNPPSPISQAGQVASNNASQSNSSNHRGIINSSSKRFRTQINSQMLKVMKSVFADYKTPTMAECETLGREIGLPKRVVQVWFQNARAKEKKARIIFAKTFGREFESHTPPIEDCKICKVRYNFKLSTTAMQEHLFSKTHIQKLRQQIDLMKKNTVVEGQDDNSCDFPVASGNPVPATMLVNPHSTTSVFPTNTAISTANTSATSVAESPNDSTKAANNLMQQLQLIQGLAAAAQQTTGQQLPLNFSELFNGNSIINNNNGNPSINGSFELHNNCNNHDGDDEDDDDNELVIHHAEDDNGDDEDTDKEEDNQQTANNSNTSPLDNNNANFSQFMQYAVTSFKK